MAKYRAFSLEAPTGINVGVSVGDLSVVRTKELDLPLRRGKLCAAGAGVLQGSHFGRVAERGEKLNVKTMKIGMCEYRIATKEA